MTDDNNDEGAYCDRCGAEIADTFATCDNDHADVEVCGPTAPGMYCVACGELAHPSILDAANALNAVLIEITDGGVQRDSPDMWKRIHEAMAAWNALWLCPDRR